MYHVEFEKFIDTVWRPFDVHGKLYVRFTFTINDIIKPSQHAYVEPMSVASRIVG